jgi:very-short-patch-repair endonuclease
VLIVPGRDFRADYCWPQHYIVVEQNGYRDHHSKKKLLRDWEKANLAQAAGWRYFQFSPKQLASVDTIEWLRVQLSRVE